MCKKHIYYEHWNSTGHHAYFTMNRMKFCKFLTIKYNHVIIFHKNWDLLARRAIRRRVICVCLKVAEIIKTLASLFVDQIDLLEPIRFHQIKNNIQIGLAKIFDTRIFQYWSEKGEDFVVFLVEHFWFACQLIRCVIGLYLELCKQLCERWIWIASHGLCGLKWCLYCGK